MPTREKRKKAKKKLPEGLLKWREKQKAGAIMKPATFKKIEKKAEEKGLSKEKAKKVAGKAYWTTVKSKYKKKKKKK